MRDAGARLHHGDGSEMGNLTIVGSLPMMAGQTDQWERDDVRYQPRSIEGPA